MSPNLKRIVGEVKPDGSEDHIPNSHQSAKRGDTGHSATAKALKPRKAIHLPHAEEETSIPYDAVQTGNINSF